MSISKNELRNAKSSIAKIFTISVMSELIRKHLVQERRNFFTQNWFINTISSSLGLVIFHLFTYKIAKKIQEGTLLKKLKNKEFWGICVSDLVKYMTHNIGKSLIISLITGKQDSFNILSSVIIGMIGTISFELLFNFEIPEEEENKIKNTKFYSKFQLYSKTIKETVKAGISTLSGDLLKDGILDTDSLIAFLIVILSLPLFFLFVEPKLI